MECGKFQSFNPRQRWLFILLAGWMMINEGASSRATPVLDNSSPVGFFTTAANLFLQTSGYRFTVTNIPVYPTNYYTPALHRLLQLSANLYDASTNRAFEDGSSPNGPFYPTVFRPTFFCDGTNVFINGYVEDISTNGIQNGYDAIPLTLPDDFALVPTNTNAAINIYGIPYVVGARKGFPNFNAFNLQSVSQITRKVQLVRVHDGDPRSALQTNIQYVLSLSNLIGVAAWNSYTNAVPRAVDIIGVDNFSTYLTVTNDLAGISTVLVSSTNVNGFLLATIPSNQWAGFVPNVSNPSLNTASFQIPLSTNMAVVSNAVYHPNQIPPLSSSATFDTGLGYIQPHFLLNMTNRLRFIMVDHLTGRIIDYVHFKMDFARDLTGELGNPILNDGGIWDTTRLSSLTGPIMGVVNQILISLGQSSIPGHLPFTTFDWANYQFDAPSRSNAIAAFSAFFNGNNAGTNQAPLSPTRIVTVSYLFQANDPLVHHTLNDLALLSVSAGTITNFLLPSMAGQITLTNLARVNPRYLPWSDYGNPNTFPDSNAVNLAVKDPLIYQSDLWQFPANNQLTFASLGSVHRGTPWQTVYLKSAGTSLANWQAWTGNALVQAGSFSPDAALSMPTNDWKLMAALIPLLAPHDAHDQFGYNQSNPNAWAPAFQGMTVFTNTPALTPLVIDTNVNSNAILQIVTGINAARNSLPQHFFASVDQLLAVPQLSLASPFLNAAQPSTLTDAAYESIPSQLLPLLRPDSIGTLVSAAAPAQIQFSGIDGYAYSIQASSNLVNWTNLISAYPTNGVISFADTNQSTSGRRFYRSVLE